MEQWDNLDVLGQFIQVMVQQLAIKIHFKEAKLQIQSAGPHDLTVKGKANAS